MERTIQGDFGWRGMNTRVAPERLEPGYASMISNLYLNEDGLLELRPGWRGILTTAQGYPIYGLSAYRVDDLHRLFWSSNNTLYATTSTGGSTATNVTGTVTVASSGMQTTRLGSYLYCVDGTNAMFRWNGTNITLQNATSVSGLTTPATAPSVSLGAAGTLVSDITTLSNYSQPYAMDAGSYAPTNLITARNFEGSSGTTIASPWNADAGQPSIGTASSTSANLQYAIMDSFGGTNSKEYLITNALTVPDESGNNGAKVYVFEAYAWAKNGVDTAQVLEAQVRLYTDSGTTMISGTDSAKYSIALNPTTPTKVRLLFDHRNITSDALSCKLRIGAPNATTGSGGAGVNVNRVSLLSPKQEFKLISSAGSLLVNQGSVQVWDGTLLTAGLRIYSTAISNQVWTGKTQAWFDMSASVDVSGLAMRLLLKSGSTWYQGGMLYKDPAGGYVADLTQFSSAVLADVDGWGIEFLEDIVVTGILENGDANLLTINGIKEGGNLSNGYTYTYRFSEWDGTSITVSTYETTDGTESSGSPISVDVTTTAGARTATLTIPARTNATTGQYLIWREGGVYDDGRYRLIGVATSSASASTYTDTSSDASLFDRPIYQIGRDQFPSGLTCIAAHQGRLWAAKGNTVYVSWAMKDGQETGVYTTLVPDPDDPYIGIKGASFALDSNSNRDKIKALVPMGTVMLAIREYSIVVISGYDATNYAAQPYVQGNDSGMVGGTATMVNGKVWYMSPLGVMEFDGNVSSWFSGDVETNMISRSPNAQVVFYNNRAFVFNDSTTDSFGIGPGYNQQVHVYDYRFGGWVKWDTPGTGTSSALALGNVRRTTLFSGSRDGQIYTLNLEGGNSTIVYGDKATPSATTTDVTYELKTRGYGQKGNYSPSRLGRGRMTQVDFDLYSPSGADCTVSVLQDDNSTISSKLINLPVSRKTFSMRGFLSSAKSIWHRLVFTGTTQSNIIINATHAYFSESEVPRI